MASEVTRRKSQVARPSFSEQISPKSADKGPKGASGLRSDGDFLTVLDQAHAQEAPKPKAPDKKREQHQEAAKPKARETKELGRVKVPAAQRLQTESRSPFTPTDDRNDCAGLESQTATPEDNKAVKVPRKSHPDDVLQHKGSMEDAPIIALFTGHLENLAPAAIPTLVSDSAFLQAALNVQDIALFMQQPLKLGDLLSALDLPPELLAQAEDSGFDPDQMVSPESLFQDLGLDPQSVSLELQRLRGTLALGGLAPSMQRAVFPAPLEEFADETPGTSPQEATQRSQGKPPTPSALAPRAQVPRPMIESWSASLAGAYGVQIPGGADGAGKPSPSQALQAPHVETGFFKNTDEKLENLLEGDDGNQSLASILAAQDWLSRWASGEGLASGAAAEGAPATSVLAPELGEGHAAAVIRGDGGEPSVEAASPSMHRATFDVWRTLGDTLRRVDTTTFSASDGAGPGEHEPQLFAGDAMGLTLNGPGVLAQPQSPDLVLRTPWQVAAAAGLAGGSAEQPRSEQIPSMGLSSWSPGTPGSFDPSGFDSLPSQPFVRSASLVSAKNLGFLPTARSESIPDANSGLFGLSLSRADEAGSHLRGLSGEDAQKRGNDGQNPSGKEGASMEALSFTSQMRGPESGAQVEASFGEQLSSRPSESVLTSAQRAHLVQHVIDRATILSRQGGGTMRLDLSSADLGRMELAVVMDDDRINLRVLTGSDSVRSALLAEMTRLREALGVQNIQLGQVEVGVAGRELTGGGQGFAGQGSFDQGRDFARDNLMRSLMSNGSKAAPGLPMPGEVPRAPGVEEAAPLLGNGRIALRI